MKLIHLSPPDYPQTPLAPKVYVLNPLFIRFLLWGSPRSQNAKKLASLKEIYRPNRPYFASYQVLIKSNLIMSNRIISSPHQIKFHYVRSHRIKSQSHQISIASIPIKTPLEGDQVWEIGILLICENHAYCPVFSTILRKFNFGNFGNFSKKIVKKHQTLKFQNFRICKNIGNFPMF